MSTFTQHLIGKIVKIQPQFNPFFKTTIFLIGGIFLIFDITRAFPPQTSFDGEAFEKGHCDTKNTHFAKKKQTTMK